MATMRGDSVRLSTAVRTRLPSGSARSPPRGQPVAPQVISDPARVQSCSDTPRNDRHAGRANRRATLPGERASRTPQQCGPGVATGGCPSWPCDDEPRLAQRERSRRTARAFDQCAIERVVPTLDLVRHGSHTPSTPIPTRGSSTAPCRPWKPIPLRRHPHDHHQRSGPEGPGTDRPVTGQWRLPRARHLAHRSRRVAVGCRQGQPARPGEGAGRRLRQDDRGRSAWCTRQGHVGRHAWARTWMKPRTGVRGFITALRPGVEPIRPTKTEQTTKLETPDDHACTGLAQPHAQKEAVSL